MDKNNGRNGIGIAGALTLIFVVLKLVGTITWPWVWVLSPIWISMGLWIVGLVVVILIVAIQKVIGK